MPPLRWGILGAGFISHDFLVGTSVLPKSEHLVIGVAARSLEKAQELAATHQVPKSYGSYEELVKDPEIGKIKFLFSIQNNKKTVNHGNPMPAFYFRCGLHWRHPSPPLVAC